jgi:hypothetical protein
MKNLVSPKQLIYSVEGTQQVGMHTQDYRIIVVAAAVLDRGAQTQSEHKSYVCNHCKSIADVCSW